MKKSNLEVPCKRNRFGYWNSCKRLPNFVNVAALDPIWVGLPRLHVWTEAFRVYAINVYKNDLPFKRTLARDYLHGLLIAASNEI